LLQVHIDRLSVHGAAVTQTDFANAVRAALRRSLANSHGSQRTDGTFSAAEDTARAITAAISSRRTGGV
jgi:hypothetical protein